jgi:methyltransferase (TIGR00027 family)
MKHTTIGAVAKTALWTAAARARETRRPDRLFEDPYAETLAGEDGPMLLKHFHTSHAAADGNPFLPIRTRWFDDLLCAVSARQIVGLGAGLDTRAYRLPWPEGTILFEVDQPELLGYKEHKLAGAGVPRCDCRRVPIDIGRPNWADALLAAGFDPAVPTVWFAEGLLFYLPEHLAHAVVARCAEMSVPESILAADLVGTGVFRLSYSQPFLRKLADAGSPWVFGTDDPAGFLSSCGWRPEHVTEAGRADASFGRWPALAAPAGIPILPRSYLVRGRSATAG